MHYIWNNHSEDKRYFLGVENIATGIEVWDDDSRNTAVNVLVRLFDLVFPPDAVKSEEEYLKLIEKYQNDPKYQEIFNYLVHFQATLDLNSGFLVHDIIAMNIERCIFNGIFGDFIKNSYEKCDKKIRYILLSCYADYVISKNKKNMFEKFIEIVFAPVNVYYQHSTAKTYIYIHHEKDEEKISVLRLAEYFLCDINREIEIMWKGEHMSFIGFDYSMIIGDMYLG